ncbi:MAG: PD-(D/E)XK nuclease family protein [Oscillospiraceae bacterium]|nr:PD-(D/E)XK nuclease family protein [Oscillospiraceae bacterium]
MLTLITGPAGAGKTSRILSQIKERAEKQDARQTMIVPEQYSHGAERALCEVCGDGIGLWAEVVSFSRLCSRVLAETGGLQGKALDAGGRVLVMQRALSAAAPALRVFGAGASGQAFLSGLVDAYDEMRACRIGEEKLLGTADAVEGTLSAKLGDLAAVFAAYRSLIPEDCYDPADRLEVLGEKIGESCFGLEGPVYVDGFGDFTAQERVILEKLLKKGCDLTVCITCGELSGLEPEFALPRSTALRLIRCAKDAGAEVRHIVMDEDPANRSHVLRRYCASLFLPDGREQESADGAVRIFHTGGRGEECELAAAKTLELVRAGARWRDIAVVSRGWEAYGAEAVSVFHKYGIPVHVTERRPVLERPVLAFLTGLLDVIQSGWERGEVFACIKTGMLEIPAEELDRLENYVHKWNIRGRRMWCRSGGWTADPEGYGEKKEGAAERLAAVNHARELLAGPLSRLEDRLREAESAGAMAQALWQCAEEMQVPESLGRRALQLEAAGNRQLAEENLQLWEIFVTALEQFNAVLGDVQLKTEEFGKLLKLVMSQYDVGTIPAALDRVAMGDLNRTKSRGLKYLLVLGCTDDSIPALGSKAGLFTDEERDALLEAGLDLSDTGESRLSREMNAVYTAFSLPEKGLYLFAPVLGGNARPSMVMQRAEEMFALEAETMTDEDRTAAEKPCFELAVSAANAGASPAAKAAEAWFAETPYWSGRLSAIREAASRPRENLSRETAETLYPKKLNLTASRVDKFYACRFSYFLQYGLKLKPRKAAGLDAPEAGTFLHYLLEQVCTEVKAAGGFAVVTDDALREMTRKYVEEYAGSHYDGLRDVTARFRYLFNRLAGEAERVVLDMAEELRHSDFAPVDFELEFNGSDMDAVELEGKEASVRLTGTVDRVDGWVHNGKLYLRVVDYKTGKKAFSLTDVWYGMGLQMLIYLFALERKGKARYGMEIVPAGVLYAPARDVMLRVAPGTSEKDAAYERLKKLRRSGLLLGDPAVLEAMDHGGQSGLLPVKISKTGEYVGDALAKSEQLGMLAEHIDRLLLGMARELRRGSMEAEPFARNETDNACTFCDFAEVCRFRTGEDAKVRKIKKLLPDEVWQKLEEIR